MDATAEPLSATLEPSPAVHRERLLWGTCFALVPTGFSFVLVSNILAQLKTEFILTNAAVGVIGGSALWGMAVSLLLAGTVYAAGVAFYFPTMVGLMSERFPRAGSLGIVLMIGVGFIGSGASNAIV